jgi:protein SCO1
MSDSARALRRAARIGLLAVTVGCSRSGDSAEHAVGGVIITPAIPKPDFVLTDTRGRPFDFRARTRGRIALLFFGYTHCPDVCPLHMANIAAALRELPPATAHDVSVVFVTTDSARDSLPRLRQWLNGFDSTFVGLTGSLKRVNAIQAKLRLLAPAERAQDGSGSYGINHSAVVLAFTRDDSAHVIYPFGVQRAAWTADLERLVKVGPPRTTP